MKWPTFGSLAGLAESFKLAAAAAEPKNEAARPVRVRLFQSRHDVVVLDLYTMVGRWHIVVVLELSKRAAAGGKGQPEVLAQEEGQESEAVRRQQVS